MFPIIKFDDWGNIGFKPKTSYLFDIKYDHKYNNFLIKEAEHRMFQAASLVSSYL